MKISCIMPSYNRPAFVLQRIKELDQQSYINWELIVVDDGSDCSYQDVINIDRPNIKYIKLKENSKSVSIPRAIGISYSTGELISHMDDDIEIYPQKFNLLASPFFNNPNLLLSYGDRHTTRANVKELNVIENWNPSLPQGWGVDGSQFIYKASVYKKINYVFCRRACDYETAKAIYNISFHPFLRIPHPVCNYIWHDNNRSIDLGNLKVPIYPSKFRSYFKDPTISLPDEI